MTITVKSSRDSNKIAVGFINIIGKINAISSGRTKVLTLAIVYDCLCMSKIFIESKCCVHGYARVPVA